LRGGTACRRLLVELELDELTEAAHTPWAYWGLCKAPPREVEVEAEAEVEPQAVD